MSNNDIPKLGEFRYPYPKNKPIFIEQTNSGLIIDIEGLDGSGKSSQTKRLVKKLSEKYEKVFYVNFIHSEYIREILLKTKWENCDINTFTLMYLMGLSNTYYREIVPKLKENYIVVLDRYIYTIISKNIAVDNSMNNSWVKPCLKIFRQPDIKIYIDTPVEICLKRKKKDNKYLSYWECGGNIFYNEKLRMKYDDKLYSENFLRYQEIIKKIFYNYIESEKDWLVINGDDDKENITDIILKQINDKIVKGINNE